MSKQELVNILPRPTFRWLQVNFTPTDVATGEKAGSVSVEGFKSATADLKSLSPMEASYTGAGAQSFSTVTESPTHGLLLTVPEGQSDSGVIHIATKEGAVAEHTALRVDAKAGSSVDILILVDGDATSGIVQQYIEVEAEAGAKVNIRKIQLLPVTVQHIEHRYTRFGAQSEVVYSNIELGGSEAILNYHNDLVGEKSSLVHDIAYLGHMAQKFDIAMLMSHVGKKSFSDIHTLGALSDTAKKSFRGTLDFIRGAVASEGSEEDTCLLLSPAVKSVSLPLLLCKEDNVVGNHAASAGQIDQSKLFYLMSRGFNEHEAKRIIVESMIRPLIDKVGDQELEDRILDEVRKKI